MILFVVSVSVPVVCVVCIGCVGVSVRSSIHIGVCTRLRWQVPWRR